MSSTERKRLLIAGGVLIAALALLVSLNVITTAEAINITLIFFLVFVTFMYAKRTAETANAAKQQADASVKMAEEMKEQRLAVKPVVIPDIDVHFGQKDFTEKMEDIVQGDIPIVLTNVGTATAIELELLLITPSNVVLPSKLPLLLPGASWRRMLPYVYDFTQKGEPIFGPPPEGKYELIVKFKSAAHQEKQVSEVSLPFDLHLPRKNIGLSIIRGKLCQKTLGGK